MPLHCYPSETNLPYVVINGLDAAFSLQLIFMQQHCIHSFKLSNKSVNQRIRILGSKILGKCGNFNYSVGARCLFHVVENVVYFFHATRTLPG